MSKEEIILNDVKDYYGKQLQTSDDLATNACRTPSTAKTSKHVRRALSLVHDEVVAKYYGCGIVVPTCLDGMRVVDLGSGSGRDCFALSKLVGEEGGVVGVDMTEEQINVANKYIDHHTKVFGFAKPNVRFVKGVIEDLSAAGIRDNSVDIVISNCVLNLCKDKRKVLQECHRVLKSGGEFYFSDVYCDRVLDDEARNHTLLWNDCVSGALSWEEFNNLCKEVGFSIPRIHSGHKFNVSKPEFKKILGDAKFASVTYRLFKLDEKNESSKKIVYNGKLIGCEDSFKFDYFHDFKTDEAKFVDGETWEIINQSRYSSFFTEEKAPCCAKFYKTKYENPFELITKDGFEESNSGGCC